MTRNASRATDPGERHDEKPTDPRKSRTIRFTDSEWEEVKDVAKRYGLPPAEFVRDRMLAIARTLSESDDATVTLANLAPLIERTFRYAHMLATRMHDDMDAEGRAGEMKKLIEEARKLQESLCEGASE